VLGALAVAGLVQAGCGSSGSAPPPASVSATIPLEGAPDDIVIAPNGSTAYVVVPADGSLVPINLATNKVGSPIQVGGSPDLLAIAPNGATAYITDPKADRVTPINLTTDIPEKPIVVSAEPYAIAITPNGATAYVTDGAGPAAGEGWVTPINLITRTVDPPITVPDGPGAIAITPNGATALVTYFLGDVQGSIVPTGTVTSINLATGQVAAPIAVGAVPSGIAITPNGATAYVTNQQDGTITPIDITTDTSGAPITVHNPGSGSQVESSSPTAIAIAPNGKTAYVTEDGIFGGGLTSFDLGSKTFSRPITVGESPYFMAISPNGTTAYVANQDTHSISVIRLSA
jgi:DNA-binding beta-propeller fold protein YncE